VQESAGVEKRGDRRLRGPLGKLSRGEEEGTSCEGSKTSGGCDSENRMKSLLRKGKSRKWKASPKGFQGKKNSRKRASRERRRDTKKS